MKKVIILSIVLLTGLSHQSILVSFCAYSGNDYMIFSPGHYLLFNGSVDSISKELEVVYQETIERGFFVTINFLDRTHYDSSLLGGVSGDKIIHRSGSPVKNEHNYWYLISLPVSFNDGDLWKHNGAAYRVEYINEWEANGEIFTDVIKITYNSEGHRREYLRGEGEVYLAKNVGIIEWEFRKNNGQVFSLLVEDWGKLPPHTVSGRITLDGRYPAEGYFIGLSNYHENDGTIRITDNHGNFSFSAYGHKNTLRYGALLPDGSIDFEELTEYEIFYVDSNITDLTLSLGYPPLPVEIDIDDVYFESERIDVGSEILVSLHLSWAYDGTDAEDVFVGINGTGYYTNETGWASFPLQRESIGAQAYEVTSVSDCDIFNVEAELESPIWDQVIILESQTVRVQAGKTLPSYIAYYEYDETPFQGDFFLNDTVTNKPIGKYSYRITGIEDEKYGLSKYSSDIVDIIIDNLKFNVTLSDLRIDVGDEPEVAVSGVYLYDNEPFNGVISLSEPEYTQVGQGSYKVESVENSKYGFTDFESNIVLCIWDRLKIIEGGASNTTSIPGEIETVWYKAEYEYDREIFDPSKGSLEISNQPAEWNSNASRWEISVTGEDEADQSYRVTGFKDEKYGLIKMNHEASEVIISWELQEAGEAEQPNGGIPGFSKISILLGVVAGLALVLYYQKMC